MNSKMITNLQHGHWSGGKATRTWQSWRGMRKRCLDSKATGFDRYGGRGITVCQRWLDSFEAFLVDMGERPEGTSLDRIDTNGNYEPGNCRWATRREQQRNMRTTKLTEQLVQEIHGRIEHGESQASVARRMGLSPSHVCNIRSGKVYPEWKDGYANG